MQNKNPAKKLGKTKDSSAAPARSRLFLGAVLVIISMSVGALSCVTSARRPSSDQDPIECASDAQGRINHTACENARRALDQDAKRFQPIEYRN